MADPYKILICDDEDDVIKLLQFQLERANFGVVVARNGLQAVECVRSEQPAIAILDWMMPVMDGVEACRLIREENKHIYIIMLSAVTRDEQKAKALKAGANDYLGKPLTGQPLISLLNEILERDVR